MTPFGRRIIEERARLAFEDPVDAESWAIPWDPGELRLLEPVPDWQRQREIDAADDDWIAVRLGLPMSGRGMIRCPAHEDQHPSLSWRWNGRLLLRCFAGCTWNEILEALK